MNNSDPEGAGLGCVLLLIALAIITYLSVLVMF